MGVILVWTLLWYTLLDYAKEKGLKVEEKPIEVFYSNPNLEGMNLNG